MTMSNKSSLLLDAGELSAPAGTRLKTAAAPWIPESDATAMAVRLRLRRHPAR